MLLYTIQGKFDEVMIWLHMKCATMKQARAHSICVKDDLNVNKSAISRPQRLVLRLLKTLFVGLSVLVRKVDLSMVAEGM